MSSRKKKQKTADFKKTKLKVGKKKVVADSFTDTSFKSKAISLPSQSITHDKTALLTNSRNVTFGELITQLKHYSPGTRKDALLGLRDLFHRHPHLLPLHLGVLINTVVRLMIDDSGVVRKALQTFLGEFIPMLHPRDIHPFLPLLVVYTCSAMTHILEDIREDALHFMDLWVAAGGQVVVNGFWDKIIPNYVSLLTSDSNATNASKLSSAMSFTASASSGMVGAGSAVGSAQKAIQGASTGKNAPGSMKAKSKVLQSLAGFLQEGLGGEGGEKDPYWFLRNFLGTAHARHSFNTLGTQAGDDEKDSSEKKSRKRKSRSSQAGGPGRSRKAVESDSSISESETSSDSEDDSASDEESEAGGMDTGAGKDESAFTASPLISFEKSRRSHQILADFPVHPSIAHSTTIQTIFGHSQGSEQGLAKTSSGMAIKIFPQQGGASASGASANTGASGSGKTSGDQLGGVQGRLAEIKPLISILHPLLLSVWLDTAPTVFSSTTAIHANDALTIVHLVLKIWGILWRAALARPKTTSVTDADGDDSKAEESQWLEEYLQSLLRHVLIYFPFGKDTVGMTDAKVASLLQDMNTTYCELTSLFLLGSGIGKVKRVRKENLVKSGSKQVKTPPKSKSSRKVITSNRPSNKSAKQKKAEALQAAASSSSSDYDSEEDDLEMDGGQVQSSDLISVQVETPPWADQVVSFVLEALGWAIPDNGNTNDKESGELQMTTLSSDFKSQHLVALLPTLWTLLNCLEVERREWVFEALMDYFDQAHVQSSTKRIVLQFLALVIKLQSHPHYTGSFSIMVPGARASAANKALAGLPKKERKEQRLSVLKLSKLLSASLLKLPKLLWDLGTERIETSRTVLDLLAWVTVIAGDSEAGAAQEQERVQFLSTLQSYMALFFCVTVAGRGGDGAERRTIMGPFVKLPGSLQRRAVEIVYYSGVVASEPSFDQENKAQAKADRLAQKQVPLLVAVKSCCEAADLPKETRMYIEETLRIVS